MRNVFLTLLAGSTALASSFAVAQAPQPGSNAATANAPASTATLADCDRLVTYLEQRHPTDPGVTVEQVRTYQTTNNAQACHDALVRIDPTFAQNSQTGQPATATNIVVQQPAPALRVEQGAPQVTVQQTQPQVTVRQGQPQITVRQPAPTVTVDIPQPEIIIRMPRPDVNVAMVQPQVQVNQPPPQVRVIQPPQQPQVQVEAAKPQVDVKQTGAAANVQFQEDKTAPNIKYERAEPRVVVNQPQGQPKVTFEQADQPGTPPQKSANAAATGTTTGVAPPGTPNTAAAQNQGIAASRIKSMVLYDAKGTRLGEVERVVQSDNGMRELIVGVGGFLGLGEKRVAISAEDVRLQGDRLVLENLTNDQLKTMPAIDRNSREFHDVEANSTIELSAR